MRSSGSRSLWGRGRDIQIRWNEKTDPCRVRIRSGSGPHLLHQLLGDDEPEPGAPIAAGDGGVCLVEGLEQLALLLFRDADAGIANQHPQAHLVAAGFPGLLDTHVHVAALGELDGVAGEVGEHLLQAHGVAGEVVRHGGIHLEGEFELLVVGARPGRCMVSLRVSRRLKGMCSSCSLPASSLEKSRMSLMIPRRLRADFSMVCM
jgi:hypothetical protein